MQETKVHLISLLLFLTTLLGGILSSEARSNPGSMSIDTGVYIHHEKERILSIEEAVNAPYTRLDDGIINLGMRENGFWLRFSVTNHYQENRLFLKVAQPVLDRISLYYQDSATGNYIVEQLGEFKPFEKRPILNPNYIFPVNISPQKKQEFFLHIRTIDQVQMPITIGMAESIFYDESESAFIFGIYTGIIVIMMLYHLMISTTVNDRSYLYYVLFILGVGLTQVTLRGYGFQYLWPGFPDVARYSTLIVPFFSGITTAAFMKQFLQTKRLVPGWHTGINIFVGAYCLSCVTGLFFNMAWGLMILQFTAFSGSVFSLALGLVLVRKKFRPATFFMIAYSVFLLAVIVYVLCNFNFLPYNRFTGYVLELGSAIQIMLLSLALADKINTYRREQSESRKEALRISLENERLIKEQNVFLEEEVKNRTKELIQANSDLQQAMITLKNTQAQLINAEKMSSLGQLTAGIAHEINNPINFVTANIKPLQLDIQDLRSIIDRYEQLDITGDIKTQLAAIEAHKNRLDVVYLQQEIDTLLAGISEGATRTAEIVRELKNFVRVDEDQMKSTDLEKGLDSTLLILKNKLPPDMRLIREKGGIPLVECMPGKINQIFMNIIVNAIDAIRMKKTGDKEGELRIKTWTDDRNVYISIQDNGIGMSESVRKNIFDPFFTTKDVGEGTGLGLAISQSIIKHHNGTLRVQSIVGEGSEFIISLPVTPPHIQN